MEKAADEVAEKQGTLVWNEGKYGVHHARLGQVRLFTASWSIPRDAPKTPPVVLRCTLPSFEGEKWRCASYADAEERAEHILTRWLSLIGASLNTPHSMRSAVDPAALVAYIEAWGARMTTAKARWAAGWAAETVRKALRDPSILSRLPAPAPPEPAVPGNVDV